MRRRLWLALLAGVALAGCSRPPPPHPETVEPATDDHPAEECIGGMCELPGAMR